MLGYLLEGLVGLFGHYLEECAWDEVGDLLAELGSAAGVASTCKDECRSGDVWQS